MRDAPFMAIIFDVVRQVGRGATREPGVRTRFAWASGQGREYSCHPVEQRVSIPSALSPCTKYLPKCLEHLLPEREKVHRTVQAALESKTKDMAD